MPRVRIVGTMSCRPLRVGVRKRTVPASEDFLRLPENRAISDRELFRGKPSQRRCGANKLDWYYSRKRTAPLTAMPRTWKYSVIIPTFNAERGTGRSSLPLCLACASARSRILIVDSESTDRTQELARQEGFRVVSRPQREVQPWRYADNTQSSSPVTRRYWCFSDTGCKILASPQALERLLEAFDDPRAAAAFGRQLARPGAGPIETHGRLFNYPAESSVRSLASRDTLGFKAIFLSNSFAAYRRTSLDGVGGFPTDVILGEDTVTAAHLLMQGWNIHYVADAEVYHSHDFSWRQEFQRYFDTGVLHSRESWLQEEFGKTGGEGQRFLRSELSYLWRVDAAHIPSALVRTAAKLAGYRLGHMESKLAVPLKARLSMYKSFWKQTVAIVNLEFSVMLDRVARLQKSASFHVAIERL